MDLGKQINFDNHSQGEDDSLSIKDYIEILKRRKVLFFIPAILVSVIGIIVAFSLPAKYRSTATISIEQQSIPQEYVRSTVTSYADQRIAEISQKILGRDNLSTILSKYDLYKDIRATKTPEYIIDLLRSNITHEMISADVVDPRSGRAKKANIAFKVGFDSTSPDTAQRVTDELWRLYRKEHVRQRTEVAASTTGFLREEAERIRKVITEYDAKIAVFKEKHQGMLPDSYKLKTMQLERAERETKDVSTQIRTLSENKINLLTQLAQIDPYTDVISSTGKKVLGAKARLKLLKSERITKEAIYSENHPDLIKLHREIKALQGEVGNVDDVADLHKRLKSKQSQLVIARQKYSSNHPDVIKLSSDVVSLKKAYARTSKKKVKPSEKNRQPDNPSYIQVKGHIEASTSKLASLNDVKAQVDKHIVLLEAQMAKMPKVEKNYKQLIRDYDNILIKDKDIKKKLSQAEMAEKVEMGSNAEQFRLTESPNLPEKPFKPNRLAIAMLAVIAAFAAGIGSVALTESMDSSVRGYRKLTSLMGSAPIASIPNIKEIADSPAIRESRVKNLLLLIAIIAVALFLIHVLFKDLGELWQDLTIYWYSLVRKLGF